MDSADPKPASWRIIRNNFQHLCRHHWNTIGDAMDGNECKLHAGLGTTCRMRHRPDLMIASGCCQAYTQLRHKLEDIMNHPTYGVMFGNHDSIASACAMLLPLTMICEQVMGFAQLISWQGISFLQQFIRLIMSQRMPDVNGQPTNAPIFRACRVVILNIKDYVRG